MMTGPVLIALAWAVRPSRAFPTTAVATTTARALTPTTTAASSSSSGTRLASTSAAASLDHCLSRLSVLQTLLSRHGAPGGAACRRGDGDLRPLPGPSSETPELVSSLTGPDPRLVDLHPYCLPLARSAADPDAFVCAYRNPFVEETAEGKRRPWPIVETRLNGPGMRLLALNSEHLMRRIACEADANDDDDDDDNDDDNDTVDLYNQGLGRGAVADAALDVPYEAGAVGRLGYGVDRYVLLRVGPFADLYQRMARRHEERGDEQSALISAEAANGKLAGFGSNFLFYARLLTTFRNREEESRDAARMCLRLPLSTVGLEWEDLREVAVLSRAADPSDSIETALSKLSALYEKMREVESEENTGQADGKTLEQMAIDEANGILDRAVLDRRPWGEVRPAVADKFRSVGREDFARFVDLQT